MIKRTPQEIADFFGCHIVQDADDSWLLFQEKPERTDSGKAWDGNYLGRIYQELIDYTKLQDEAVIYKPQPMDAIEVFKSIQERKNSAPHQSEVHTHEEYMIVRSPSHDTDNLSMLESCVMIWVRAGWKPIGGVTFDKKGYPCQAMVRGI